MKRPANVSRDGKAAFAAAKHPSSLETPMLPCGARCRPITSGRVAAVCLGVVTFVCSSALASAQVVDSGVKFVGAVNAGVNTSSGLQFEVSDPSKGRDEGLRAAFADARAKAALLASAAGRTLGRAVTIAEGAQVAPPQYPRPMAMRAEAASVASDVPVESGTQENVYTVSVVFEIQ